MGDDRDQSRSKIHLLSVYISFLPFLALKMAIDYNCVSWRTKQLTYSTCNCAAQRGRWPVRPPDRLTVTATSRNQEVRPVAR